MLDACIVGGGVSGLVFALRFRERYPTTTIAICEKNDYLGGRLLTERFHGFRVPHGGSMVRGGDKRVMALCAELGLTMVSVNKSSYLSSVEEAFNNRMVEAIKERGLAYKSRGDYGEITVREFMDREFSPKDRDDFVKYAIYRDFLSSSLKEFMDYYPPDDLYQPEGRADGLYIVRGGYGALVDNLVKRVREDKSIRIYLETKVNELSKDEKTWTVKTPRGDLNTSLVIWATDWSGVKALPKYPKHLVEEYIAPVPFFRAAAYSTQKITEGLITGGDLGKVFPLMRNVFQLAYTETDSAERLNELTRGRTTEEIISALQPLLDAEYLAKTETKERVEIEDVIVKYWKAGIHQYIKSPSDETMEEIQKPFFGFYLIGEMVVRDNKGWVEGALQSVEEFFDRRTFQKIDA